MPVIMRDFSGFNRHGTYNGPVKAYDQPGLIIGDTCVLWGPFDDLPITDPLFAAGYGVIPASALDPTGSWTIGMSLKLPFLNSPGGTEAVRCLFGLPTPNSGSGSPGGVQLDIFFNTINQTDPLPLVGVFIGQREWRTVPGSYPNDRNGHQVVVTFDQPSITVKVYVDGVNVAMGLVPTSGPLAQPIAQWNLAGVALFTGGEFPGYQDEVFFIPSVISASDIAVLQSQVGNWTQYTQTILSLHPTGAYHLDDLPIPPPLRQRQRDDFLLGYGPRISTLGQGGGQNGATSLQLSQRRGSPNTYL